VAFYEGCQLEPGKLVSSLTSAASPHANHGCRAEFPESIHEDGMVTEVLFQQRPVARNRCGRIIFHCKTSPLRHFVGRSCVQQDQEGSEALMRRENGYREAWRPT
jgi:hypothetical protein